MNTRFATTYNPWPIGKLPKELQRPEPELIRDLGYNWTDAREIITMFENKVAEFAGSKYAVAVDCCTHAIELSLRWKLYNGHLTLGQTVYIPEHTYVSIYLMLKQLGFSIRFYDGQAATFLDVEKEWSGVYPIYPTAVHDGAVRWSKDMFREDFHCLSFQIKKRIPIGRGGMVLTDNKNAANWIRLASYDGRDLKTPYDSPGHVKFPGYHYYMIPEDAARGLLLMDAIKEEGDSANWTNYPNIKTMLGL